MLTTVLCLLPALLLALPLLARRYPGERVLVSLRTAGPQREPWPRPRASVAPRWRREPLIARGGQLLARSLAVRPPPVRLPAS
ncbi:MAG TPA: hypothetical protein VID29_00750 [Solirubrobacteraceae bacterium]